MFENYRIDCSISDGITQNSLMNFRNTIAKGIEHEIKVLSVSPNEMLVAFLIIDKTAKIITWTGDGFRQDYGGEGGAGYNTVQIINRIFNVKPHPMEEMISLEDTLDPSLQDSDGQNAVLASLIRDYLERNSDEIRMVPFECSAEKMPDYIRTRI